MLLNLFFNPAVNAARGVAYQAYSAVQQLVTNFFTAVKPQIYKSYASEQYGELYKLINRSTMICAFLISLLVFPIIANTELLLGWWLKKVPEYTVIFTQLVLINGLVDSVDGPTIASALATGKIKRYMQIVSGVILANIPLSYIALLLGCEPWITMFISIGLSMVAVIVRGYLLKGLIGFPFKSYLAVIAKIALVSIVLLLLSRVALYGIARNLLQLCLWSAVIVLCTISLYAFILAKEDRNYIVSFVKNKFLHR